MVWLVLDRVQSRSLSEIFPQELGSRVQQQARESLIRFSQFIDTYSAATRLLANHRRMATYLQPLVWTGAAEGNVPIMQVYVENRPPWLPELAIWRHAATPVHMLLVDAKGAVREAYQAREGAGLGRDGLGREREHEERDDGEPVLQGMPPGKPGIRVVVTTIESGTT
mgnify:CR=1 FL=1